MTTLVLDVKRSTIHVRTSAEGMFARLAHDLELTCGGLSGSAERSGDGGTAKLDVPIARIAVGGTRKGGQVDPRGLSAPEREEVLDKMRHTVFGTRDASAVVHVEAVLEGGLARVTVRLPSGRAVERAASVRVGPEGDGVRASGTVDLSLVGLGAGTVKGPMNAFRVSDRVVVAFDVVFVPPEPS